jgi:3',5'-cyclic AMP phosphodiesterase CpdA
VSVRIAHLSDIHFGGENADATHAAVEAVAAFAPSVTIVTGDLTLNGLPREFKAARTWLDRLPRPLVATPGNHDTPYWNLVLRAFTPFRRYRQYIGPADACRFDGLDVTVRCLNSARGAQPRPNWSKGAIALDRLQAIDWGHGGRVKVFACHHPLIDIEGAPVSGGVHRGARAAAILAIAGVDLILTGHVHNPFALALPAQYAGSYALGAGTLSVRTRGTPPGFSLIVAEDAAFEVTALGWTGHGFEPVQVWRLPRTQACAVASIAGVAAP